MSGIRTPRARPLAALVCFATCLTGQACKPLIYEVAGMDSEHTGPGDSTGMTTEPTPPGPTDSSDATTHDGTGGPSDPGATEPAQTCGDGWQNGAETDFDCGGDCKPCAPGQTCDDPKDCLLGSCVDGVCAKLECMFPQDCAPTGPCMQPTCTPDGHCIVIPAGDGEPCEDDDLCTLKSVCKGGACLSATDVDCSGFDGPCRAGVCNPNTGACLVDWLGEGEACDDGLACTFLEQCSAGECVAKPPPPPPPPLLVTDFSVMGGWKAAPPWAIGPAKSSQCSPGKAEDPADDHSPGADASLAGAAIGGCLPTEAYPDVCLESPPVDVMFMEGELALHYWSVLGNAAQSRVEVFDGKIQKWMPLAIIDGFTIESDWTEHTFDLTPFKGPALRVRFCHAAAGKSEPVGGWSIDDLSIGAPQCF